MVCTISGKSFDGDGKSKKEAKLACSQKAIEVLYGYKMSETKSVPERSNPRANCDLDDWMELEGKNPVSILNELYPGIQYQLVSTSGPSHAPQFVIKASLNDMSFEGSGKSKKDAKLNASKALLVHLHKVGFDPMTGDMMSTQKNNDEVAEGHTFADQIGQLVTAKYQALFGTTTYAKRRVMSGVVMSRGGGRVVDADNSEVVCVSSGTKCINGEQLSLEGCVINDSHAEIVARRCLVVYLYSQLELHMSDDVEEKDKSIFEASEDGDIDWRFRLKEGVSFHLFITTSPCGDARIFSLHESPSVAASSNNNSASASNLNKLSKKDEKTPSSGLSLAEQMLAKLEKQEREEREAAERAATVEVEGEASEGDVEVIETENGDVKNETRDVVVIKAKLDDTEEYLKQLFVEAEPDEEEGQEEPKPFTLDSIGPPHVEDVKEEQEEDKGVESGMCSGMETPAENEAPSESAFLTASAVNEPASAGSVTPGPVAVAGAVNQQDSSRGMLRSKIECGMGTVSCSWCDIVVDLSYVLPLGADQPQDFGANLGWSYVRRSPFDHGLLGQDPQVERPGHSGSRPHPPHSTHLPKVYHSGLQVSSR